MGLVSGYNLRSMLVRKGTAAMTAMGIAMVVAVFVMTLAIAQGFRSTLVASGSTGNAIVLRKSATSETVSAVLKNQLPIIESMAQVARDGDGHPLASPELVVIISLPRISDGQPANVPLRGVGPRAYEVRDTLQIVEGRRFVPGTREINVGRQAVGRFRGLTFGSDVKFGGATWKVVGIFTADDASFESEVWGDVDLMMPAFQRGGYQSVTVKLSDPAAFSSFDVAMGADPRLDLKPQREREYYEGQSETTGTLIRVFATFVTAILSIGAMFGAMNTMYAAVAYRTREIGTLRALGFSRGAILTSFQVEALAVAAIGFVLGALCSLALSACLRRLLGGIGFGAATFTVNVITLRVSATDLLFALLLALVIGTAGGFGPAWRAARLRPIEALRKA